MKLGNSGVNLKLRLGAVFATSLVFLITLAILGYVVSGAFSSMASNADAIDDARAVTAAKGALRAMQKQLGSTVRDNAYWDDAFAQLSGPRAAQWATENWGATTADYPLYDTAMVIDPDGKAIMAYHKGATVADPNGFFLGKLDEVLVAARRPDPSHGGFPVAFIRTQDGVAIIGAAAVQPTTFDISTDPSRLNVLIFSKQLTSNVIAEISRTFTIGGLAIEDAIDTRHSLYAKVPDVGRNRRWASKRKGANRCLVKQKLSLH